MSELGRPSGRNIAAPLFDKCIEQLGVEVAARRAHTRTNEGDGLPMAFFARGGVLGRRRKVESTRDHHAHRDRLCHFRCHPLGREGGREDGKMLPLVVPSFISFPFSPPAGFDILSSSESRKVFLACLVSGPDDDDGGGGHGHG